MPGPEDEDERGPSKDMDEPVAIPLEFEEALKGLLAVDPTSDGPDDAGDEPSNP